MLPGIGQSSCTDVMLMMRPPPPWAIICFAAICVPKNALFRLMSSTFSYCSSVVSSIEVRVSTPALFTMMSSRPNAFTARVDQPLEVGDLAHVGLDADRLVAERGDLLLELLGGLRVRDVVDDDVGALLGRARARSALPMPLLPPVTMATFPSRLMPVLLVSPRVRAGAGGEARSGRRPATARRRPRLLVAR